MCSKRDERIFLCKSLQTHYNEMYVRTVYTYTYTLAVKIEKRSSTSFPSRDSAEDLAFGEEISKPTAFPAAAMDALLAAPPAADEEAEEVSAPSKVLPRLWFDSAGMGTSATSDPPLTVIVTQCDILYCSGTC